MNWYRINNNLVAKIGKIILEISFSSDDDSFFIWDMSKGQKLIGVRAKLKHAKSFGKYYLSDYLNRRLF